MAIAFLLFTVSWIAFVQGAIYFYSHSFKTRVIEKILRFIDPEKKLVYFNKLSISQMLYSNHPLINISVFFLLKIKFI